MLHSHLGGWSTVVDYGETICLGRDYVSVRPFWRSREQNRETCPHFYWPSRLVFDNILRHRPVFLRALVVDAILEVIGQSLIADWTVLFLSNRQYIIWVS